MYNVMQWGTDAGYRKFSALIAWGQKLSLNWVVWVVMHQLHFPGGGRVKSVGAGWLMSLMMDSTPFWQWERLMDCRLGRSVLMILGS